MDVNISSLENILNRTIKTIETSKEQIFDISENARTELEKIVLQLAKINEDTQQVIQLVDKLEIEYKKSRVNLANVSKKFKIYSETNIQKAYEETNKLQLELLLARERESNLRIQRDELQIRIKNIEFTIERADILITQVSVIHDYLKNDVSKMTEIMVSSQLNQMIGVKIIQAQEEEKKRIAREIHDGPAQSMANVVLRTEIIERLIDQEQFDSAKQELKDLKNIVRQNLADVRQIIFDLRPMVLDDLGLFPTLRKYVSEIVRRENLSIQLNVTGKEKRFSPPLEVALFRLTQELLNNVIKHANATEVIINIDSNEKFIKTTVEDNGRGFIVEEDIKSNDCFGLIGLKERVHQLDGKYEINSIINKGTSICFKIPIIEGGGKVSE
ncbi:MAG: sensor histidine kinase [Vulcanibacillus sp.]